MADSGNNRIQIFTAEGKFVRIFGKYGHGKGELDYPVIDTNMSVTIPIIVSLFSPPRVSLSYHLVVRGRDQGSL